MFKVLSILLVLVAVYCFAADEAHAQTTEFTYQGSLSDGAVPANGNYDLEFKLFDLASGGAQQGSTLQRLNVPIAQGIFTVSLDFGAGTLSGADRFLDIALRTAGGGAFTPLSPRQKVNSAPYAVRSLSAATADSVAVAGLPSGSANYIQNTIAPQASSNFNISGDGIVGGKMGIGTSSPQETLHVKSNSITRLLLESPSRTETSYKTSTRTWITGTDQALANSFYIFDETANRVRMSFAASGTVGIGTTTPLEALHVRGLGLTRLQVDSASGRSETSYSTPLRYWITGTDDALASSYYVFDLTANAVRMAITTAGNVGVGTTAPQRLFHVNGRGRFGFIPLEASIAQVCFNAAGDLLQCGASSLKWKTDIRQFDLGLETVLRLRPIRFTWKESGSEDFGLGAEDVAQIAPELAFFNSKGEVEGVKYERLSVILINAVKEQQEQIEALRQRVERQEIENEALRSYLCKQDAQAEPCRAKK